MSTVWEGGRPLDHHERRKVVLEARWTNSSWEKKFGIMHTLTTGERLWFTPVWKRIYRDTKITRVLEVISADEMIARRLRGIDDEPTNLVYS